MADTAPPSDGFDPCADCLNLGFVVLEQPIRLAACKTCNRIVDSEAEAICACYNAVIGRLGPPSSPQPDACSVVDGQAPKLAALCRELLSTWKVNILRGVFTVDEARIKEALKWLEPFESKLNSLYPLAPVGTCVEPSARVLNKVDFGPGQSAGSELTDRLDAIVKRSPPYAPLDERVIEWCQMLELVGCADMGHGNTLTGMVQAACREILRLRR